jgi:hypothetical protein
LLDADRGYFSGKELKKCGDAGITPFVPALDWTNNCPSKSRGIPPPDFYEGKFIYDRRTDAHICPAIKRFRFWTVTEYTTKTCLSCRYLKTKCTTYDKGRRMY